MCLQAQIPSLIPLTSVVCVSSPVTWPRRNLRIFCVDLGGKSVECIYMLNSAESAVLLLVTKKNNSIKNVVNIRINNSFVNDSNFVEM